MPIYEYRCDRCGAMRELILKPGETAQPSCTDCRRKMRRVISPTSFILKGSGWYVTDYPSEARKKGLEGEKAPPATATSAKKEPAPEKVAPEKKAAPPAGGEGKPKGKGAKKRT